MFPSGLTIISLWPNYCLQKWNTLFLFVPVYSYLASMYRIINNWKIEDNIGSITKICRHNCGIVNQELYLVYAIFTTKLIKYISLYYYTTQCLLSESRYYSLAWRQYQQIYINYPIVCSINCYNFSLFFSPKMHE